MGLCLLQVSLRKGSPLRLGILGGTFDPIHLGHLRTAEEIGQALNLDKVYLIPSASPPHKTSEPVAPFDDRLAMVQLAVGDSALFEVLDLEGKRPGLSYSIETLKEFYGTPEPQPELFFILGTDAFREIKTWRDYQDLFDYAHFVIIERTGVPLHELEPLLTELGFDKKNTDRDDVFIRPSGKRVFRMSTTLMDISSTRIRQMVAEGRSIRFLLPDPVRRYLMDEGLYKKHANPR
jgi:nicotinate-nucleotide adenylyltransferase